MKATDFFRALDESDLDVYETRYLMRVWRRGMCWEKLQSIADTTGMSIGKASQVKKSLEAKGWLKQVVTDNRIAYQVAIPAVVEVQDVKPIVVEVQDVKPIVVEFHVVEPEFHEVKQEFHVVSALPLIDQKEDHTIKSTVAEPTAAPVSGVVDEEREATKRAIGATVELVEFWEELTKRKSPPPESVDFRDRWFKPFNEIWIACGRNVDAAKAKVQAVRDSFLARNFSIFDPAKLPAHVQALVDAELLPMTARLNGNGYTNFKNDPSAREAHNRAVFDQVAQEMSTGEWSPWMTSPSTS